MNHPSLSSLFCVLLLLICFTSSCHAFTTTFVPHHRQQQQQQQQQQHVFPPVTSSPSLLVPYSRRIRSHLYSSTSLPEISTLKIGDMRKELESYGISTKSFLEKKEFVQALTKARAEGMTPKDSSSSSSKKKDASKSGEFSRDERISAEMERCQQMKVLDLRKELESLGISTKSFFEKSEFVKTLATARVDGVAGGKQQTGGKQQQQEQYDPAYRDVKMQKFNGDPNLLTGTVIDVRITTP